MMADRAMGAATVGYGQGNGVAADVGGQGDGGDR